jgi:hypothetical protein
VAGTCDGVDLDCATPCPDQTAFVAPKYYVLSLIYSPPGCTSTSNYKCPGVGKVDYGQGATLSTKTIKTNSFDQNITLSVDMSFTIANVFSLGGGASQGWHTTTTDTNSQTISTSGTLDINTTGNNDGIDHDQDMFLLFLNPAVAMRGSAPNSNSLKGCAPTQANWYVGSFGTDQVVYYPLWVYQAKNPQSMPPNVAKVFQDHGFTANDFANILTLDPFAQGQTTIDPVRFIATKYVLPYTPPPTGTCSGGQCSCEAYTETLKNELQSGVTQQVQNSTTVGFNESAGINIPMLFSETVKSTQTFTFANTSSTENDTDGSQSASVTINCASPAYTQPTDATHLLIYWDRLFGTFLFVPSLSDPSQEPIQQGFVMRAGTPVVHVPVQFVVDGKKYYTLTDTSGKYVFYGKKAAVMKGILTIGGNNIQLPLSPMTPMTVEIQ